MKEHWWFIYFFCRFRASFHLTSEDLFFFLLAAVKTSTYICHLAKWQQSQNTDKIPHAHADSSLAPEVPLVNHLCKSSRRKKKTTMQVIDEDVGEWV